jgi:hypothetical protein
MHPCSPRTLCMHPSTSAMLGYNYKTPQQQREIPLPLYVVWPDYLF